MGLSGSSSSDCLQARSFPHLASASFSVSSCLLKGPVARPGPSLKSGIIFASSSPSHPGAHSPPLCVESSSCLVPSNSTHYLCPAVIWAKSLPPLRQTLVSSLSPSYWSLLRSQSVVFLKHAADPQNPSFRRHTVRLVGVSLPSLLADLALLSPPDCVLRCSLFNLSFSHNEPHVVCWTLHAVLQLHVFKIQRRNGFLLESQP